MTPAVIIVMVGAGWRLLRPSIARNVYGLLCADSEALRKMVFSALESKDGRIKFRAYTLEVFADRVAEVDEGIGEALSIANANKDALTQVSQVQLLHGKTLSEVQSSVKDIPQLSESLRQLAEGMSTFAKEMKVVNDTLIRQEERERIRQEERRYHQTVDGPRLRHDDHSPRGEG